MALAGAAVADRDDVLAPFDVLRSRQLHHQRLVQGRQRREVEAVEALHGRELCRLDAALDHAPLAIDQLLLGKPQQIAWIVGALSGALPCNLVVLAQERRELESLEVVSRCYQTKNRFRATAAAPPISAAPFSNRLLSHAREADR